jgi:hypothetical protein
MFEHMTVPKAQKYKLKLIAHKINIDSKKNTSIDNTNNFFAWEEMHNPLTRKIYLSSHPNHVHLKFPALTNAGNLFHYYPMGKPLTQSREESHKWDGRKKEIDPFLKTR